MSLSKPSSENYDWPDEYQAFIYYITTLLVGQPRNFLICYSLTHSHMYTVFLRHQAYLSDDHRITMPFLPNRQDWLEIPVDVREKYWPGCAETLFVVEKEHLFDEQMQFYGTRLHLQDWEGN